MAIRHRYTNPKSDGGDSTIVRPSNWNDTHFLTSLEITDGVLTPASISSDQNNYDPTNWNGTDPNRATILRLATDRPWRAVTGLGGGAVGRIAILLNVGSYPILLADESASSSAANRFSLGLDIGLWPGDSVVLHYDNTLQRWEQADVARSLSGRYQQLVYEDEFLGGGTELGEQGALGWFNTAAGTAVYTTTANGSDGHIGVIELQTGTTSGNHHGIQLGQATANGIARAQDISYLGFIVAVPTITTVTVRLGLAQDATSATHGTDGYWFEFDPASDASWRCNTRAAGASGTIADTTVNVVAGNWYLLEAFRAASNDLQFFVNGVQRATFSANIPSTVACSPCMRVVTNAAAARNLRIDWFKMRLAKLGQRWT